ncbi:MAG: glycosyltransferase [Cytophagaceae bacterium]
MRKLKIGFWLGNEGYSPESGGAFGYRNQLINKIKDYSFPNAEIVFISDRKIVSSSPYYQIKWKQTPLKRIRSKILKRIVCLPFTKMLAAALKRSEKKDLQALNSELGSVVDLIYYPTPECVYPDFPFIYTKWDAGHLSTFAFPEMTTKGEFEHRVKVEEVIKKALLIFAESEAGKKEIEYYYRINPDRIYVVPIFPSGIVNPGFPSSKPAGIKDDLNFIHYPAQFWPHKNHYNLIQAFKITLATFPDLKLVLTGSEKGNKPYIFSIIQELGIKDSIIDTGFVSMEELKWLYLNSKGLVMPTFLGPTNMPLLEAAELGCPVACSNLGGHIEQLKEYGYYFDPASPKEISDAINRMVGDKAKGLQRKYESRFTIENALHSISSAFDKIKNIRFTWK